MIGYLACSVDRIGLNVEDYLNYSPFQMLNTVMKMIKSQSTSRIEHNFNSFSKQELWLLSQEASEIDQMIVKIKGMLSCLHADDELMKKYIRYIKQYPKLKHSSQEETPFFE